MGFNAKEQNYKEREMSSQISASNVHPKFHRVRTVTVHNNRITCNCSFTPVNGLPCVHVLHVAYLDSEYAGPTRRDCSIFWWKDYISLGFNAKKNYKEREMNTTLCYLRNNEEDGLYCNQIC